jgi:hypothetical protein
LIGTTYNVSTITGVTSEFNLMFLNYIFWDRLCVWSNTSVLKINDKLFSLIPIYLYCIFTIIILQVSSLFLVSENKLSTSS